MADDESTNVAEDTSVDETTNTSTDAETEFEDIEVSLEDLGDETPEDEEQDTEPVEEAEEDEVTEDVDESEEESEEESTDEETELSDQDKQKAFNKEMAERRIQDKRQKDQTIKEQQQDYLAQADDDRDLALRQLQVDAYTNKVEGNTNKLTNGYEKAVKDFEILASDSPEIKAEVDAAIDAFQALYVTVDAYGNPIDVRGDLYTHLQSKADSIAKLTGIRNTNQKNSKDKEKSKTLTTPSRAPKEPKVDPMMVAFDEEANR